MSNEPLADPLERAVSERETLIRLCVYALDRARSTGVTERLEEGLDSVGVTALRPRGEPFDPARHEAGGVVATADHTLDGLVAETETLGFADRGRMVRPPVVTVYRLDPAPERERTGEGDDARGPAATAGSPGTSPSTETAEP
ncbi:nucleotide exchange factor GrpE [Actinopolyspora mortivallis]|uniref:nucleotide exchange factor GrpE n=1 Tax=Actinopolyspora mortivallis TaxID=33906 RepID=UPI000378B342|nr:nucleotide exchange factor GrpE [Actinopolyspora mortivallis]